MQELVTRVKRKLDPDKEECYYVKKLKTAGYFWTGNVREAATHEQLAWQCKLLWGEAQALWTGARAGMAAVLRFHLNKRLA